MNDMLNSSLSTVLAAINALSSAEKKIVLDMLSNSYETASEKELINTKFVDGVCCPHCGAKEDEIKRNGSKNNRQRFMCKHCGKTFSATNKTVFYHTRKPISVWKKYISCIMEGMSLRKAGKVCNIHRNTALLWRHKILNSLAEIMENVTLSGVVEADETYYRISYKGNHKNNKTWQMPRKARKRGNDNHVRGMSRQQVCVPCAINRKGLSISRIACRGIASTTAISAVFGGHIAEGAILCTDEGHSYRKFAADNNLNHVQINAKKRIKGAYGIQCINSYHGKMRQFMERFNGVSTRFLNNYILWHNFVNHAKETADEKFRILWNHLLSGGFAMTREEMYEAPIPFAA